MRETYGLSKPRRSDTSTRGGSQATAAGRASECKYTAAIEKEVQASCGLGLTRWRDASASSVAIGSGPGGGSTQAQRSVNFDQAGKYLQERRIRRWTHSQSAQQAGQGSGAD